MDNPWIELPDRPPYVLPKDAEAIRAHNATANERLYVHLQCMPEPYIGDLQSARVVILGSNPGYDSLGSDEIRFSKLPNIRRWRANLLHQDHGYFPFFVVDPRLVSEVHPWFGQKTRALTDIFGVEHIGRNVASAELFPYHSLRFPPRLSSAADTYTTTLIRSCLKRQVVFIVCAKVEWVRRIPELADYAGVYQRKNPQQGSIGPGNLTPHEWEHVVAALACDIRLIPPDRGQVLRMSDRESNLKQNGANIPMNVKDRIEVRQMNDGSCQVFFHRTNGADPGRKMPIHKTLHAAETDANKIRQSMKEYVAALGNKPETPEISDELQRRVRIEKPPGRKQWQVNLILDDGRQVCVKYAQRNSAEDWQTWMRQLFEEYRQTSTVSGS